MIYLVIFWIILIIFIILYYASKFYKLQALNQFLEKEGALLFIAILTPIILIAITTKDPISFGSYQIPTELQWLGSLFASFFGAWQFYLKPLKNKVFGLDREIGEVKTSVKKVETDVNRLTDFLKSKKQINPFDLNIEPIHIPKFRINPDLLDILADRRRNRRK